MHVTLIKMVTLPAISLASMRTVTRSGSVRLKLVYWDVSRNRQRRSDVMYCGTDTVELQ